MLQLPAGIECRVADPETDFDIAYDIFKRTISDCVKELNAGVWPEEERKPFFRKGFKEEGMCMLLHEGKPIGCFGIAELDLPVINEERYLSTVSTYKAIVLQRMYIEPEFQRRGIGAALIDVALKIARQYQLPLELEVLENNEKAIRAYKKGGFEDYKLVVNGWNRKYLARHRETTRYLPWFSSYPEPAPTCS